MKVVLFGNSTWCIYNFRLNLIRELNRRGHSVSVIAPFDPSFDNETCVEKLRDLSVDFHLLPLKPRNINPFTEALVIIRLFLLFVKIKPDFVLSYTVKCNLYTGLCRKLLSFRQVANIPGLGEAFERPSLLQTVVRWLYRFSLTEVQTAFFQNKEDLDFCTKSGLIPMKSGKLIQGSGVDLSHFSPSFPPRSRTAKVFVMFGRLLPQKGYYQFLDAARKIKSQMGSEVIFKVQGIEDKNRWESAKLLSAIKKAEAEGIVTYSPNSPDVLPLLNSIDVAVLPSFYNEGVPRSLLEAMAMGKPIITTDWKGCRETVVDGKNGILIPVKDTDALVDAILAMCKMSESELSEMGRASRSIVEQNFDERIIVASYISEILGRRIRADEVLAGSAEKLIAYG